MPRGVNYSESSHESAHGYPRYKRVGHMGNGTLRVNCNSRQGLPPNRLDFNLLLEAA